MCMKRQIYAKIAENVSFRTEEVERFANYGIIKTKINDKFIQRKWEKHEKVDKGIDGQRCEDGVRHGIAYRSKQYILLSSVSA